MANMPFSYSVDPQFRSPGLLTPPHPQPQGHSGGGTDKDRILASAVLLVHNICDPVLRERALTDLSKKREIFYDLAPILWESFGTITALLKEVVSIYPLISPPTLSSQSSTRICNALALLQCVASHPDTKIPFLNAHIPLYLYPFLNTTIKSRPFEYLRLTSLGVIGALVKEVFGKGAPHSSRLIDDADAVRFLLHTEIVPLCLRTMENGTELSRTVATFIIEKILVDELGLRYISTKADRFYAVTYILRAMVESPTDKLSARLLKHIIRCYLRLTEDERSQGCVVLHEILPTMFRDGSVEKYFREDAVTRYYLQQLLVNVYGDVRVYGFEGGIDRLSEL